jgi:flagellar motor switch protein FliM
VNNDRELGEFEHGARKLEGAMLEQPGVAFERMPGLTYALNRFIAAAPARLSPLISGIASGGSMEQVRSTTLFRAVGDCSGLTAAVYATTEPESRLLIALDEHIDDLIVSSVFGEAIAVDSETGREAETPPSRTSIETALVEEFARALGKALEAAFAPLAPFALSFERLVSLSDPFALGRRDTEAAAARFSLPMSGGSCECLVIFGQTLLLSLRKELAREPRDEEPATDRRWSRLMEVGVQQTQLPMIAILEEVSMRLGDVAGLRVGGVLPLQCSDFDSIRLECSGRGMFTCRLGQGEGRYRLEIENSIAAGSEGYVMNGDAFTRPSTIASNIPRDV